ncbi:hypothetical protein AGMMS50256_17250 [Betaproteobacteria bacterium]|nr:hypothetical protein AGMMS50256_17250 [Betaproteobacteria bacterium]
MSETNPNIGMAHWLLRWGSQAHPNLFALEKTNWIPAFAGMTGMGTPLAWGAVHII